MLNKMNRRIIVQMMSPQLCRSRNANMAELQAGGVQSDGDIAPGADDWFYWLEN